MQPVYDEADPFEELARAVIRISFVLRQDLETVFNDLSEVPRELVRIIVRSPGLTVVELAAATGKQRSNTSAAIAELEQQGLVSRKPHESDKRSVRVFPSAKAQNEIRRIYRHWASELSGWAGDLDDAQRDALIAGIPALRPITDSAERVHEALPSKS